MSKRTEYKPGVFNWVDLMAKDLEAAKRFYGEIFGWKAEDQETDGDHPYVIFTSNGEQVAGMGEQAQEMQQAGVPAMWNNYVKVDDAKATVEKAEKLGANVIMPAMEVMEAGWMAILQDPEGAMFSVWQPKNHIGATLVNEPGAFCWNEMYSRDLEGAQKFYGELFDWTFDAMEAGPNPYRVAKVGEDMNGGIMLMNDQEMKEIPVHWLTYFAVEDCDATVARIQKLGGRVMMPPMDMPPGRFAAVADPEGAPFGVIKLSQTA